MNAIALLFLAAVVLADDCGHFQCGCVATSQTRDVYDFITDASRTAVKYYRYHTGFADATCEKDETYVITTEFNTVYKSEFNNTSYYERTLVSMKLAIKKEEALATLQCEGVEVGATLDLMAAEDKTKCTSDLLTEFFEIKEKDDVDITIIDTKMHNPSMHSELCEMMNVNSCYVVYPNRALLYTIYSLALISLVTTIVIYSLFVFGKSNTLPITQPKNEGEKEVEMAQKPAEQPAEIPAETSTQPTEQPTEQPAQPADTIAVSADTIAVSAEAPKDVAI